MIEKTTFQRSLAVHPLLQIVVLDTLTDKERSRYFEVTAQILRWGFPNDWQEEQGHRLTTWPNVESCVAHVMHLFGLQQTNHISVFGHVPSDLYLQCSWYVECILSHRNSTYEYRFLYEHENYRSAITLTTFILDNASDRTTSTYARAFDLVGLIHLTLACSNKALSLFEKGLKIWRSNLPPRDPLIAYSLNNLALAYTEMNDLKSARTAHDEAISIRLESAPHRIGNSYINLASLLLRMEKPDEAENTLAKCPSLKDFTDGTFLATDNPRFSGSIMLLSRIRRAQGRHDVALGLASKALELCRLLVDSKCKICILLYDVASLLQAQSDLEAARGCLLEVITTANVLPGHLARAKWRLSGVEKALGRDSEASLLQAQARGLRDMVRPDLKDQDNDEAFESLCPWMLW